MAVGERDKISGQMTTGHEWNGINEPTAAFPTAARLATHHMRTARLTAVDA